MFQLQNVGFKPAYSVRTKVLPQYMEALRADERVGFIRLSRTEGGIYPAHRHCG